MAEEQQSEKAQETGSNESILQLTDEEIMDLSPEEFAERVGSGSQPQSSEESEAETESSEEGSETDEEGEEDEESEEASEEPSGPDVFAGAQEESSEGEEEGEEEEPEGEESSEALARYRETHERLFAPFKAAGREIRIKSVDDAINLMQMGVDYREKMQKLRPQLKVVQALERNKLLDEAKINHLIDMEKGNKEAIAKFLRDKGIDTYDLNTDEEKPYTPQSYAPSDKQMALDEVLDSIRGTEQFQRTLDELGNKWDVESKNILMDQPQLIKAINDHIGAGIYDQIMNAVVSERALGRLIGLSDLAAYKQIGDALQAQGAFKNAHAKPKPESKPESKPSMRSDIKDRKRAASSPRGRAPASVPTDLHPLAMSDDEVEKLQLPGLAMH